ncbi:hypothetical protein GCM10008101_04150 [Lysobacter xinjiangensis]|uniref:DUF1439 domain-containing protein n=1 Tax=Cognatilysobacter xinjiangensis TaxID=546892 RepID=A0ABQ3BQL5_9GAMM|nr:DUF1439 domain-containing protein [Lysobacter xinjiangensis]GGZ54152.1 hypothetical protein GCM10008101_04150 [Lysobacter xinjiangensis]
MRRALPAFVFAASAALFLTTACSTVGLLLGSDTVSFSQQEIQQRLVKRFPRDYQRLGGLVTLTLMNPRLSIPPGERRLQVEFDMAVGALGHTARTPEGSFTLTSALRYDPATRGLHLFEPRVENVQLATLGGRMNDTLRGAVNEWLSDWSQKEPIYEFDDTLIGRLGARRVEGTKIQDGQVVVQLGD